MEFKKFVNNKKVIIKFIALFLIALAVEFCLSNNISDLIHPDPKTVLDLSTAIGNGDMKIKDSSLEFTQNASAEFILDKPVQSQNIYLRFDSTNQSYLSGKISITDESRVNAYEKLNEFTCNPNGKQNTVKVPLHSNGKLLKLKIEITDGINGSASLCEVILNEHKIHFQPLRFFLMILLIAGFFGIRHFNLMEEIYDVNNKKSNYITTFLWLFSMGIAFFLLSYSKQIQEPVKYPLENAPSQYSIMIQQFDALQKGQLSLDYQEHELKLSEIENPYDLTQRNGNENYGSNYWDHAYYNNKIYSYFGIAPIITVYYPYYWITGTLPTDATVAFYFAALAITLCFLLIRKCITCFQVKASILDVSLFFLALPAVSHLFLIQGSADIYYIPLIAVNTFLLLFLYGSLNAYTQRGTWHGIVWYAIAGLALGLSAASRPTTIIPVLLLILPLYFHVLWDKNITKIQKTKLVAGFSVPVCISAILIMWYNSARFGSPFDFGAAHQITASDIHYNHISIAPSRVASYLYQYWFMPFDLSETFPFLNFDFKNSYLYGNFTWVGTSCIAVFSIPLNLTLLCLPNMITWCKSLYQKAMLLCGFIGCFIILYIDFCLGGVHMRYSCDASLVFAILSLTIMCYLLSIFRKHHLKQFIYIGYLLIFLSILLDYLLIFVNERNYIKVYAPDIFLSIKHLFSL